LRVQLCSWRVTVKQSTLGSPENAGPETHGPSIGVKSEGLGSRPTNNQAVENAGPGK